MKTALITALVCTANLLSSCVHTQQSDAGTNQLTLLRAQAEKGEAQSQFELGAAYYWGKFDLATNYVESVKWFRKAAEQNHAQAQHNLGDCYAKGHGVAKDLVEAVKWWRKAAEQNLPAAQSKLGGYERGDGVAKYESEALKWYLLAAAQGDTKAKSNVTMLELMLSPEQIAEGKRRAQDWLEQRKASSTNNQKSP